MRGEITEALQIIRQASGISMSRHFHAKSIECYCHPHYFEKDATKKGKAKKSEAPEGNTKKDDAERPQIEAVPSGANRPDEADGGAPADPKDTANPAKAKSGVWSAGPLVTFFSRFSAEKEISG